MSERDWSPEVAAGALVIRSDAGDPAARQLSNMHPCGVRLGGVTYPSAEHAFQCIKMLRFGKAGAAHSLRAVADPKACKRKAGRRGIAEARLSDAEVGAWNGGASREVMLDVLRAKYAAGSPMAGVLLSTGGRVLVEKLARFGDRVWGVNSKNVGENRLGRLLMEVRAELGAGQGSE